MKSSKIILSFCRICLATFEVQLKGVQCCKLYWSQRRSSRRLGTATPSVLQHAKSGMKIGTCLQRDVTSNDYLV